MMFMEFDKLSDTFKKLEIIASNGTLAEFKAFSNKNNHDFSTPESARLYFQSAGNNEEVFAYLIKKQAHLDEEQLQDVIHELIKKKDINRLDCFLKSFPAPDWEEFQASMLIEVRFKKDIDMLKYLLPRLPLALKDGGILLDFLAVKKYDYVSLALPYCPSMTDAIHVISLNLAKIDTSYEELSKLLGVNTVISALAIEYEGTSKINDARAIAHSKQKVNT